MFSGLTKGLQLIGNFIAAFIGAVKSANAGEIAVLVGIGEMWISEALDVNGIVKSSLTMNFLLGVDPFAGSRHAFEQYQELVAQETAIKAAAQGALPIPTPAMTPTQAVTAAPSPPSLLTQDTPGVAISSISPVPPPL